MNKDPNLRGEKMWRKNGIQGKLDKLSTPGGAISAERAEKYAG
jgi:hypothetical protein